MKKLAALMLLMAALTGCVYVQDSHSRRKGTEVSKEQAALVQPGKTNREWVIKNLGTPDRIQADKDGHEVFEYVSEQREHSERRFIILFSIESDAIVSTRTTRVVLKDGIVQSIDMMGG